MPVTAARLVLRRPRIAPPLSRQKGVVLLATLLLLVIAASFVLVGKLNVAATSSYRDQQTAYVLSQAKQGLLGYAAHTLKSGPITLALKLDREGFPAPTSITTAYLQFPTTVVHVLWLLQFLPRR